MTIGELIEALQRRRTGQEEWLLKERPQVFEEQLHIVTGTVERVYWHYGYMVALRDVLNQLEHLQK